MFEGFEKQLVQILAWISIILALFGPVLFVMLAAFLLFSKPAKQLFQIPYLCVVAFAQRRYNENWLI